MGPENHHPIMRSLVFALLLGAAFATKDDKIIGGRTCDTNSQPHQVSLNSGYHFCGGSLLNENWVVSSAHCFMFRVEVRLGKHNIDYAEDTEQFITPSRLIIHPKYNPWEIDNDIMLIKLSKPATLNKFVQPIALPTSCAPAGTMCLVSGWGSTGNYVSSTLQCLELPILTDWDCKKFYPGMITDAMFCAGFLEGGKDAGARDDGGPLVCNDELQGVTSWGYLDSAQGSPSVYTKVCMFKDWLERTMASY